MKTRTKVRNYLGAVAAMIVALDCVQYADGDLAQSTVGPHSIWLWYIPAISWASIAIGQFMRD